VERGVVPLANIVLCLCEGSHEIFESLFPSRRPILEQGL
jgi:hypothetical protein